MMGFTFQPEASLEEAGARAYFQDYATQRRAFIAAKGGFDSVVDEDGSVQLVEREKVSRERQTTISEPVHRIEPSDLGTAPKRVYAAAEALGLQVRAWRTVGEMEPVLYVHDSKEGAESQHLAGEVRYPSFIARRYIVEAAHLELGLGFQAHYMGEGAEGKTAAFQNARVKDPLGIEVENRVDYTLNAIPGEKPEERERRIQMGMAMNNRINDGSTRVEHIRYFTVGGDFTRWLDDYLTVKGIKPLTPQRKPKETAEEREQALIQGGEWNG